MSGKKQKIAGWYDCPKCKIRFSRQFITKHSGDEEIWCRPVYPYLKDNGLICPLSNVTPATKKIGELPFIKDKRLTSSTIFVSEELIKECGLTTFGWVSVSPLITLDDSLNVSCDESNYSIVSSCDVPASSYAFRTWPIPESIGSNQCNLLAILTLDGFGLNNLVSLKSKTNGSGDAGGSLVRIQKLSSSVKSTSEIFLSAVEITLVIENFHEVDKISFDLNRFVKTFLRIFQGRPIALHNRFKIRFYAQHINFYVSKLSNDNDLDESLGMHDLSLQDNSSSLLPKHFHQITSSTVVNVVNGSDDVNLQDLTSSLSRNVTLNDIGGMTGVLDEICLTIKFIINTALDVPKGVLLYGHPGIGKSIVVEAITNEFKLYPIYYEEFNSISVGGKTTYGTRSSSIEKIFKEATARAPTVIIVDALDVVCPRKNSDSGPGPLTKFAADFLKFVSLQSFKQSKTLIICTATDLDRVDLNMRSPKIFSKEIEIPVPSIPERDDILRKMLRNFSHSLTDDDIKVLANSTHGFVAADLQSLCNKAHLDATTTRVCSKVNLSSAEITMKNMQDCLKSVKPSAIKSILIDVPNVKWCDIGGQDELKFKLKQAIEWPLKHPESFKRLGITPPKGILMYGPPGCSKTMIAKAIATESGLNFISVKGSELFSKWVGESEKAVQGIFRKARQVAPCVIFFDEIDSLGGERGTSSGSSNVNERVLAQILVEIDGIEALRDVTIVAATNRPDRIDQALLRPGRLDRIIYVPLPDENTRKEILKIRFKKMPVDPDVDLDKIAQETNGYSGAELTAVCHEAALKALEEDITSHTIKLSHFKEALSIIKPRITKDQISFYENYSISRKTV